MKIIVAMNNSTIKEAIDIVYKNNVYKYDLCYMEDVIKLISQDDKQNMNIDKDNNLKERKILITKDTLEGSLNSITYIKQIRLADPSIKIILFVSDLTQEYKEFLFSNEVFNIIESESITIKKLQEYIESDKYVIYDGKEKQNQAQSTKQNQEKLPKGTNNIDNIRVISKQLFAVYGTDGSGKSYISSILSQKIAKKLNVSVGLLDMDIENASLDIFNTLDFNINSLSQIIGDIDKDKNINKSIFLNSIKKNKRDNISYITNKCSLYECQNKLTPKYYKIIYNECKNIFDYTILDLPSSPFIDVTKYSLINANKVIFVLNPNYLSLRQAIQKLDTMDKLWNISKQNIYIVINKFQKNSLDIEQIENILNGYKIIQKIDFDDSIEGYINGANQIKMVPDFNNLIQQILFNNISSVNNKNNNKVQSFSSNVLFSSIISNFKKINGQKEYDNNDSKFI